MTAKGVEARIPDHVPAELVWDHSFIDFLGELGDPFLAGSRLHDGPGIIWATNAFSDVPAWIFTRHALIHEGFSNSRKFSSLRGRVVSAVMDPDWMMLPVEADAPEHQQYRQVLRPFFTREAMASRFTEVQRLCDTLIDSFIDKGRCEFIGEFAAILPNAIVISMLGMPQEMLQQFMQWEEIVMRGATNAERIAAGVAIHDYLGNYIAEQTKNPTNELMQAILAGRMNDRPLNDAEKLGIVYLLFVAGLDTVFASLGWIMRHLAIDQALQARLRNNPDDVPAAIEEFTRAFGVSAPTRIVAEDMVFEGVPMKKGDDILLPAYLAGRDPRAFPNPHVIDIDRKPIHVTFGSGPHVCLGIHLAKREMRIVIDSFLSRMKHIRMPEGGAYEYHAASTIGVDRLDLVWEPA
jgi:cytochrome P450